MRLIDRLMDLGDSFRIEGKPLPVIETDVDTALGMAHQIEIELGGTIRQYRPAGTVIMFDGIAIKVARNG